MYIIVIDRFMRVGLPNHCYEASIKADILGTFTYLIMDNGSFEHVTSFLVHGVMHPGEIASFSSH
jgi:hypothetical protein